MLPYVGLVASLWKLGICLVLGWLRGHRVGHCGADALKSETQELSVGQDG